MASILNSFSSFLSDNGKGIFDLSTPEGGNVIPEPSATRAQKTFSTNASIPNFPKPKSLFFVCFHINPEIENKIIYKQKFMEQLLGGPDKISSSADVTKETKSKLIDAYKTVSSSAFGSAVKNIFSGNQEENIMMNINPELGVTTDYIETQEVLNMLAFEMSKMVKEYTKPGVNFAISTLNEYNRQRKIYSDIKYNPVTLTFYDVKDSPVQRFFIQYLKYICADFFCKDSGIWELPIDNCHWRNAKGYTTVDKLGVDGTFYGNLNPFGLTIDSNFRLISKISFCEYYMNKMTVYTIENPIITKIDFGNSAMGDFAYNDIKITFEYEGITNDLDGDDIKKYAGKGDDSLLGKAKSFITGAFKNMLNSATSSNANYKYMVNHEILSNVGNFMQTRYSNKSGSIVSDIASTIKAYMNGDVKFSWKTVKNQALDTMRKYNMSNAANTIVQVENSIKAYKSKEGKDKVKFLINDIACPTSVIGRATTGGDASGRGVQDMKIVAHPPL